jgi:hypothetical protein
LSLRDVWDVSRAQLTEKYREILVFLLLCGPQGVKELLLRGNKPRANINLQISGTYRMIPKWETYLDCFYSSMILLSWLEPVLIVKLVEDFCRTHGLLISCLRHKVRSRYAHVIM